MKDMFPCIRCGNSIEHHEGIERKCPPIDKKDGRPYLQLALLDLTNAMGHLYKARYATHPGSELFTLIAGHQGDLQKLQRELEHTFEREPEDGGSTQKKQ